jgi:hypothetical protein
MKTYFDKGAYSPDDDGIMLSRFTDTLNVHFDFDTEEVNDENPDTDAEEATEPTLRYSCELVRVKGANTYASIVSAIVNDRYNADDAQALTANYNEAKDTDADIDEDKRAEYIAEYVAFQSWRKKAKDIARKVVAKLGV